MRLEIEVEVGGTVLADGESGVGELARILMSAAGAVLADEVRRVGDSVTLYDFNERPVGEIRMTPEWGVGDEVFVTCSVGTLVEGVIEHVDSVEGWDGFHAVRVRARYTHELLPWVYVDHRGLGRNGSPILGRVRS